MPQPVLEFRDVVKHFGAVRAVDRVSFSIEPGEVFTLLGPSGCGKTTTLRLVAGLEEPEEGEILINGSAVASPSQGHFVAPDKRQLGMVFQSYAIWPHLTVFENVAFPLRVRRERNDAIRMRVRQALEAVGLAGHSERGATQLSGGQQQRVALARALVYQPSLLLLDEPLSNLDAKLREQMRLEIRSLQRRLGLTILYVTHDQGEAMTLSDRIAVVERGRFVQVGTPAEVYEQPASLFVAEFLGRVVSFDGTFENDGTRQRVTFGPGQHQAFYPLHNSDKLNDGMAVRLYVRPEDLTLLPSGPLDDNQLTGHVEQVAYLGDHIEYEISAAGVAFVLSSDKRKKFTVGSQIRVALDPAHVKVLPA